MFRATSNVLLVKDEVGMARPCTRELPVWGHSYGLPGIKDPEGVGARKSRFLLKLLFL